MFCWGVFLEEWAEDHDSDLVRMYAYKLLFLITRMKRSDNTLYKNWVLGEPASLGKTKMFVIQIVPTTIAIL